MSDNPIAYIVPNPGPTQPVVLEDPDPTPIRPLSAAMSAARMFPDDSGQWRERGSSYFRDLLLVSERQERVNASLRAAVEDPTRMVSVGGTVPTPIEAKFGGLEGAIDRLTRMQRVVEERVKKARKADAATELMAEMRSRAIRPGVEQRAITTTSGGPGLVPAGAPTEIASAFADAARTKSPLANALLAGELPPIGTQVIVPRFSTGAAMTVATAEAAAVGSTDPVSLFATGAMTTVSGEVTLSRQLFDRGVNVDEAIAGSLGASFAAVLEAQVINGSGASGQITGILGFTGIQSNAYTDAAPTRLKNWQAIAKLLADTATAYGAPVDTVVYHPRRYEWLCSDATLVRPNHDGFTIIQTTGVPTNLGAGTNEDRVIVLVASESPLYVSPPEFQVVIDRSSANLQVQISARAYVALPQRQPASIGILTSTGLVSPTF